MSPYEAYRNALINGPSKETRETSCTDPVWAYCYARDIDKCPGDDTRNAACKDPECAYWYALEIDKEPREDTRKIACEKPEWAYLYAKDVDKGFHKNTWEAVKNTKYEEDYKKFFNSKMKEEII